MQAFKFAILEFDYLLTNNVNARDPVGSNNVKARDPVGSKKIFLRTTDEYNFHFYHDRARRTEEKI